MLGARELLMLTAGFYYDGANVLMTVIFTGYDLDAALTDSR